MPILLRFLAAVGATCVLWLAMLPVAGAADCDIVLDVSGSMGGFRDARQGQYGALLDRLEARCAGAFVFGETFRPARGLLRNEALGDQETLLGAALEDWQQAGPNRQQGRAVVFVTDNVATDGTEADLQQVFYDKLFEGVDRGDPTFDRTTIIATRLTFDGELYPRPSARPESWIYYRNQPRALALYVLGVQASESAFVDLEQDIIAILDGLGLESRDVRTRPFFSLRQIDSSPIEDVAVISSNSQTAVQVEIEQTDTGPVLLLRDRDFSESVTIPLSIEITPAEDWTLNNAEFSAVWRFEQDDEITAVVQYQDNIGAQVTPRFADLEPGRRQQFDLTFELASTGYFEDVPFWEMLSRAWSGTDTIEGSFVFQWTVATERDSSISVAQDLRDEWSLDARFRDRLNEPSEAVQARIFRLDEILVDMVPQDQFSQQVREYPIRAEIVYPAWPAYVLILLIVALLVLLAFLLRQIFRTTEMVLSISDADERRVKFAPFGQQGATGAGGLAIRVRYCLLFFFVTSSGSVRTGRFVGLAGGEIAVAPRGRSSGRMPAVADLMAAFNTRHASDEDQDDWAEPDAVEEEFDDDVIDTFELRPVEGEEYDDDSEAY